MANTDYSEYTMRITNDPSYYGANSQEDADTIVENVSALLKRKFPGLVIEKYHEGRGSCATTGPSQEIIDDINRWAAENWTAAL